MVGDNRHDLEMARAGGAGLAVGVLSGTGTRETLAPMADVILDSIADLPGISARAEKSADMAIQCPATSSAFSLLRAQDFVAPGNATSRQSMPAGPARSWET